MRANHAAIAGCISEEGHQVYRSEQRQLEKIVTGGADKPQNKRANRRQMAQLIQGK